MKNYIYIFISFVLLFSIVWAYKTVFGKPFTFNTFAQRVFIKSALADPEMMTFLGSFENTIFDFHSSKLTDISKKANLKNYQRAIKELKVLQSFNREKLTTQEKITYDILNRTFTNLITLKEFNYGTMLNESCPYPVNQLFGFQSSIIEFMINNHQLVNYKSAKNYISRLEGFKKQFADVIKELELREKNGIIPPRFVIEEVLQECQDVISKKAQESILYTHFEKKINSLKINEKNRRNLKNNAISAIQNSVYPSYKDLINFLEKQKLIATNEDGVWKLPEGNKYYNHCLKTQTTTDLSAPNIHELGERDVSRIQNEMRVILDKEGYKNDSIQIAMQKLGKEKRFLYSNTEEGKKQIIKDFETLFENLKKTMPKLFSITTNKELKIEKVPDFKAKTAPMAYYQQPSLDGSRAGIFFINTYDMNNQAKFAMPTLAYHEGIPGHHFQISIALDIKHLPTIRKLVDFTAYIEGWALYCERLTYEAGLITNNFDNLGRLQMELMRAVRLVVDTGIHHKKWTREQAIGYMTENTGMNESDVVAEVERYIVLPGQACSYKIGMMKILELREKMKDRLKDKFDIKDFHKVVLENGALPLSVLEKLIDQEIELKNRSIPNA